MVQEEIDKGLMELIPKDDLTEEEFNEASADEKDKALRCIGS